MTDRVSAAMPAMPSRVRIVRPAFYRASATGSLTPDARDLLIGLTTIADDEGWLLWQPAEIAATLYVYQPTTRRLRDFERRAERLSKAELVVIHECGCAFLPTMLRDHAIKGGSKSSAIWSWHQSHLKATDVQTSPDKSVSYSVSDTESGSSSPSVSGLAYGLGSTRAREDEAGALCVDCRRPQSLHAPSCIQSRSPFLSRTG